MLLKGKVIYKDNEKVISVFYLCYNVGQVSELVLVNFNHPKTPVVILIEYGSDTGGFTRTAVTIEQHVVCSFALYKSPRVCHELFLLYIIANQIIQPDRVSIVYRNEIKTAAAAVPPYAKGSVYTEKPYAIPLIMICYQPEYLILVFCRCNLKAQFLNLFAYVSVVDSFSFGYSPVI